MSYIEEPCGRVVRLASLVLALAAASPAWAQQAMIIVRHAEQAQDGSGMMQGDPALNEAGQSHAKALASYLKDAGITAIFTSQYDRARQTAAPLAAMLKLQPGVIMKDDVAALADAIRSKHARDVVLVVGHSDTIPTILKTFGVAEPVQIDKNEFDNVWLVVPRPGDKPVVSHLRF
jgi:broad specificity phosphatase PhoE